MSTTTLIEPVDASNSEARSMCLGGGLGGPRLLHIEQTGAVDSSRKFHRVVWKYTPMQLLPAILMRGPAC